MGCLSPMKGDGAVCSICSHDNSIDNPRGTLPAGTVLEGRYLVGAVRSQNDLTIVYIGLDLERGRRVYVEEFMPRAYADRCEDRVTVAAAGENQAQYKTLLSDIRERWKLVGSIENKCLMKTRELLLTGNTAVCISSYVAYVTLEDFLEERGPLSWGSAKELFMPLASLVIALHDQGVIHYGISPQTIVVDRKGGLRLIGFALPELRTVGRGLSAQLYDGYSPPEQYAKSQWQGEWSDIYALGAVLYRILTGTDPEPAIRRSRSDSLPPVQQLQREVPGYISDAVAKAMALDRKDRYQTAGEFQAGLLEEAGSNTTVFRRETAPARPAEPERKPPYADGRLPLALGLVLSVILNIVLAAGLFSPQPAPEPPSSEQSLPPPPTMELFEGQYWPMLEKRLDQYPGLSFATEEAFDEEAPAGVILRQSVPQGADYPEDGRVILTVSQGSQFVIMPRVEGCTLSAALYMLDSLGITWYEDIREDSTLSIPVGTVVCDTPPGSKVTVGYKVRLTIRTAGSSEPEAAGD